MSHDQLLMLTGAAAFSLPSLLIIFFLALFALLLFLKPRPSAVRIVIAFVMSLAAISFYIPFKSLAYYELNLDNRLEMYAVEIVVSVVALLAATKLSLHRARND